MRIGLSLSLCIRDIIAGNVDAKDVVAIVSNTCARDEFDVQALVARYSYTYWRNDPQIATQLFWDLWNAGKIIQPRLTDPSHGHCVDPCWLEVR